MPPVLKIKRLSPQVPFPRYASEGAAGFDVHALEDIAILPGEVKKIPTGLAVEIPTGHYLQMADRGGLALRGIHNVGGIIDEDYRGEIQLLMLNTTQQEFLLGKGNRIAQALLVPILQAELVETNTLSATKRGEGRFHSTGA